MRKTKKVLSLLLGTALVLGSFGGCTKDTPTGGGNNQENKNITITVGAWPPESRPGQREIYAERLRIMNEKYPEITIIQDEWTYDFNTFIPKANSGQLPTIFTCPLTETKKIIQNGYVADITDILAKTHYLGLINEMMLELLQNEDKIYGLPGTLYHMGLMANVNLFREADLLDENGVPKFPATWDELAEFSAIIKEKTGKAGFVLPTMKNVGGWHFMNIARGFGVEFMKNDGDKWVALFNSQEAINALQFVKDLKWKYNALPDSSLVDDQEVLKLFASDQAAMALTDVVKPALTDTYGMEPSSFAIGKPPGGEFGRNSVLGGTTIMFSPTATNEQIEASLKWLDISGLLPKIDPTDMDEYFKTREKDLAESAQFGQIVGAVPFSSWNVPEIDVKIKELTIKHATVERKMVEQFEDVSDVVLRPEEPMNCQELYKMMDSVIQAVITDKNADPKDLLEQANADFQRNYLDKVTN